MSRPTFKRPLPWLIGLGIGGIVLIGGSLYAIFFSGPSFDIEALTVPATSEALTVRIEASGTAVPIRSVNISPKNAGIVQQLGVEQGAEVEAGQPLAQMDNAEIRAQGEQAVANLREAVASLDEGRARLALEVEQAAARVQQARAQLDAVEQRVPRDVEIARAEIIAAQERLERAEQRFQRYQLPNEAGAVSQNIFDEAAIELRAAETNLRQAIQTNLQRQGTARPEIQQAGFAWVEAQAALRQARSRQQNEVQRLEAVA
ncbi:MAG: biotin/lipoyl-binding protein, partial [Spirulinaceae cyanobacterium RM2_2_10]|nr:biotin/lipoyl-binding protein [Spirulinaceae cyanobacterium RM2_2_10]